MNKGLAYLAGLLTLFTACSGYEEDPNNVPEGTVRIFAESSTTINANGEDQVVFRVMYGSQNISNSPEMNLVRSYGGETSRLTAGVNTFSTLTPGTYIFTARYFDGKAINSDNEIEVTVLPTGQQQSSNWYKRVLAVEFTSVWCIGCPDMVSALNTINSERPDLLSTVAFHMDYDGDDPMTMDRSTAFSTFFMGSAPALPGLFFNMHQPLTVDKILNVKSQIDTELNRELESWTPSCGLAMNSEYNEETRKVNITVKVKSNRTQVCRLAVFLTEDGIVSTQLDDPDFVHNHVVRAVLSSGVSGDLVYGNLPLYPGTEYEKTYSTTLPAGWNADNMNVVATVLNSPDNDGNYRSDNTIECPLVNGSSDYLIIYDE